MKYLLMIYVDEAGWPELSTTEKEQGVAAYKAYTEALKAVGVFQETHRLASSSTATRVRRLNDRTEVLDGPYADSKEQIAGLYLIDVPDFDAALSWAARCPAICHGVVEIRQVQQDSAEGRS